MRAEKPVTSDATDAITYGEFNFTAYFMLSYVRSQVQYCDYLEYGRKACYK